MCWSLERKEDSRGGNDFAVSSEAIAVVKGRKLMGTHDLICRGRAGTERQL